MRRLRKAYEFIVVVVNNVPTRGSEVGLYLGFTFRLIRCLQRSECGARFSDMYITPANALAALTVLI